MVLLVAGCSRQGPGISGEKVREYANELYNRQLYGQAIEQYRYYLEHFAADENERANIIYRIAEIYFNRLHDYQNALAEYLKIRTFYPESAIISETNKRIVACLERLNRPEDARQALEETTALNFQPRKKRPGTVIARIGEREITQGDLDFEISQLPPEIRTQYQSREKKLEFLRRYIATELLYDSAKRRGLDQDKEVIENVFQAKKTFMVQKLLEEEISKKVQITDEDIRLYYEAHKKDFAEKDKNGNVKRIPPLAEIREQVAQRLLLERQQKAYEELIQSLLRAENVKIYEDLVK
jgi:hypothetical protein